MIVPYVPMPAGGGDDPNVQPDWLKLEPGEQFVRVYGGRGVTKQMIAIKLMLVGLALAGVGNFYLFSRRASIEVSPDRWPILAVVIALVLLAVILAVVKAARRGGQAYLTTRMLIVKRGRGFGGIPLSEVTRIRPAGGMARRSVEVFTTSGASPVASLPVADPQAAAEELASFAQEAGAKLS